MASPDIKIARGPLLPQYGGSFQEAAASRQHPSAGKLRTPRRSGCMDERVINDGTLIRSAAGGATNPTAQNELIVIKHEIETVEHHDGCGAVAKHATENDHPQDTDSVNRLAEAVARRHAKTLDAGVRPSRMRPPERHDAVGFALDITPYGTDLSLVKHRNGRPIFPPLLTINGEFIGPDALAMDGHLAAAVATGPHSAIEFTPKEPLVATIIYDSANPGRIDPKQALDIARGIQASYSTTPIEIQTVDMARLSR